jgi:hypothetical protein
MLMGEWMYRHIFLTSTIVGFEWSVSCPGCFTSGANAPVNHWMGSWVSHRAGQDDNADDSNGEGIVSDGNLHLIQNKYTV